MEPRLSVKVVTRRAHSVLPVAVMLAAVLVTGCASPHRPGPAVAAEESDRVDIARAVLGVVLTSDRTAAGSYATYLLRESRVVRFTQRHDGRWAPDEHSEQPPMSWGTDLERIVRGTAVRPGPVPASVAGCPTGSGKSLECRPPAPFTRYVMSQPAVTSGGEARVALTTTHHRRGDPRPFGIMRAFLLMTAQDGWRVTRVDTTGIT